MPTKEQFIQEIEKGYTHKGEAILLGGAMYDKTVCTGSFITIPLKTMNRHGLIAGATGSGKTKTLQILAEQLEKLQEVSLVRNEWKTTKELLAAKSQSRLDQF